MNFKTLQIDKPNPTILIVRLNRPELRNAINSEMMQDLKSFWQMDLSHYRCIILTGQGTAFCAGADLKERNNLPIDTWKKHRAILIEAIQSMVLCPIPIIAAVNGAAFGGGLELVLACDFSYAAENAIFAQSEVKLGIIPGALGTQHLPRACGLRRAKELTFTGDTFTPIDAYQWGIVNKVYADDELLSAVLETANKIADNAPLAMKQIKKALDMSQQLDIQAGFSFEQQAYNNVLMSKDRVEGILAFNEKRKPKFTGE
jgi:enoyl-CoA hydratase/carnithine racemase